MRAVEVDFAGRGALPIDGYGAGGFRLAGAVHRGPLALLPGGVAAWAGLPDLGPFLEHAGEFDLLIVGLGAAMGAPGEAFVAAHAELEAAGPGVEPMATPAACRCYNVLLAEGRRVAAALMPV
jgi:uncharacterized protein